MEQRHGHYDEGIGRPNTSAFSRPLDQENFIGESNFFTILITSKISSSGSTEMRDLLIDEHWSVQEYFINCINFLLFRAGNGHTWATTDWFSFCSFPQQGYTKSYAISCSTA